MLISTTTLKKTILSTSLIFKHLQWRSRRGDFNNDGLPDLYFTGNMVPNKLYLSQGNLQFKDITAESHTDGNGEWCRVLRSLTSIMTGNRIRMFAQRQRRSWEAQNTYINRATMRMVFPYLRTCRRIWVGWYDAKYNGLFLWLWQWWRPGSVYRGQSYFPNDYPNHFRKR